MDGETAPTFTTIPLWIAAGSLLLPGSFATAGQGFAAARKVSTDKHPYLFFTSEDLPQIRERPRRSRRRDEREGSGAPFPI